MQCYKMNEKNGTMGSWNMTSHATKLIFNEDMVVKHHLGDCWLSSKAVQMTIFHQ